MIFESKGIGLLRSIWSLNSFIF